MIFLTVRAVFIYRAVGRGRPYYKEGNLHKMENITAKAPSLSARLAESEKIIIGIGSEWALQPGDKDIRDCRLGDPKQAHIKEAYQALYELVRDRDYYLVTSLTDGAVYDTPFDKSRLTAPCGNIHWRQCSKACTKDIWEEFEVLDGVCPHCGGPLTGNTIKAETYIEEGYLPGWKRYMAWQAATVNRTLTILELGENFSTPTVMRWPFEKIIFFNRKSLLYRVNETFFQIPPEAEPRSISLHKNSLEWILEEKNLAFTALH